MRLIDDDVNLTHHIVSVRLLEVLHAEAGTDFTLEATLLALEVGISLQFVTQLAEAAARVLTDVVFRLHAARHQRSFLDGNLGKCQRSFRHLTGDDVVAVAGTVDAVARRDLAGTCDSACLLADVHRLQRVTGERADDVHLVETLGAAHVLLDIQLDDAAALALLGESRAYLSALVAAEGDTPLTLGLHFEGQRIVCIVKTLQILAGGCCLHHLCQLLVVHYVILTARGETECENAYGNDAHEHLLYHH